MPAGSSVSRLPDAQPWVIAADAREGFGTRIREVWQYRRTLSFFAINSVQALYAKTRLGMPWLFIRPLFPLLVGTFVFGSVMKVPSGRVPYFIFFAAGQLAWNFFDGPLIRGSRGLDANRHLLTKLYVPRVILPLGQMASGLVDTAMVLLIFMAAVVYYRAADGVWYVQAGPRLLGAAGAAFLILVFAFALTLWTSVWQARARDMRFVLRHVVAFWLYFTPVIYPLSMLPPDYRWLAYLNPLTAPVETFKWALLSTPAPSWPWLGYSAGVTTIAFLLGSWYFASQESATMDKL